MKCKHCQYTEVLKGQKFCSTECQKAYKQARRKSIMNPVRINTFFINENKRREARLRAREQGKKVNDAN